MSTRFEEQHAMGSLKRYRRKVISRAWKLIRCALLRRNKANTFNRIGGRPTREERAIVAI